MNIYIGNPNDRSHDEDILSASVYPEINSIEALQNHDGSLQFDDVDEMIEFYKRILYNEYYGDDRI